MAFFIITPPAGVTETDAGRIEKFLENKELTVQSVSVLQTPEGVLTYQIESDIDPRTVVQSYVKAKSPQDQARDKLSELRPKLLDGTATVVEMRLCLLALVILQDV